MPRAGPMPRAEPFSCKSTRGGFILLSGLLERSFARGVKRQAAWADLAQHMLGIVGVYTGQSRSCHVGGPVFHARVGEARRANALGGRNQAVRTGKRLETQSIGRHLGLDETGEFKILVYIHALSRKCVIDGRG